MAAPRKAPAQRRPPKTKVEHNGRVTTSNAGNGSVAVEPDEVFDLDALEADAELAPFPFTFSGRTWYVQHPNSLDWHVEETLNEGSARDVMATLMGDDFAEFDELVVESWRLDKLLRKAFDHFGIDLGELEASPGSSGPTGPPSRRTSATTTASRSRTSRRGV